MRWSGVILLLFVVYHLMHFTFGNVHPDFVHGDVYHNFVAGFQSRLGRRPSTSLAMLALGLHLHHGVWSMLQTLGLSHPRYNRLRHAFAARRHRWWWCVGNISFPVAVLAGSAGATSAPARGGSGHATPVRIPDGPIEKKWEQHRFEMKLVNPANKRKYNVIVVGTGLAGASAAATLAELGYNVSCFCYQDSPRRAHSIAAQGGINAAKNYQNDGDSVFRLFYDTVKGGDFRAREAQRLPPGPGQREHHRPVRGPGRAVRPRVRRAARQPLASAAPRSRAPSTPAARPASSSCSAPTRPWSARSAWAR